MKREVYQVSVPVLSSMWLCLTPFDCTHLSPMSPQPSQWDSHPLRNKVGPFEMSLCSGTPWSPFVHTVPCSTVPLSRLLGLDICSVCGSLRFSAPRGPEFAYVPLSSHIRLSLGADGCWVWQWPLFLSRWSPRLCVQMPGVICLSPRKVWEQRPELQAWRGRISPAWSSVWWGHNQTCHLAPKSGVGQSQLSVCPGVLGLRLWTAENSSATLAPATPAPPTS